MPELRKYECEHYSVMAPPTSCFFCARCTDIWFDFTNGPYMFWCEADRDVEAGLKGECAWFVEDRETIGEEGK